MRIDPLKQYAKLRQQLLAEKTQLESRLAEINEVLSGEPASPPSQPSAPVRPEAATTAPRRTRRARGKNRMSMREAVIQALSDGPLARQELVGAVEATGYKFTTNNPLNSIGSVLYGKNSPVKNENGKFFLAPGFMPESSSNGSTEAVEAPTRRKKRKVSAESRARMSAAQRARRARQREAQRK